MAYAEIRFLSSYLNENNQRVRGSQILDPEVFTGSDAITEASQRFKYIREHELTDWIKHLSSKRVGDHLFADVYLEIGPWPKWSDEYLKDNGLGKHALEGYLEVDK